MDQQANDRLSSTAAGRGAGDNAAAGGGGGGEGRGGDGGRGSGGSRGGGGGREGGKRRLAALLESQSEYPEVIEAARMEYLPLPNEYEPSTFDVICGRGRGKYNASGNVLFRNIVKEFVEDYVAQTTKNAKTAVLSSIADRVRAQDNGRCRFVKSQEDGTWVELGLAGVHEKVGHAMREALASWKKEQRKSTNAADAAAPATAAGGQQGGAGASVMTASLGGSLVVGVVDPSRTATTSSSTATSSPPLPPPPPGATSHRSRAATDDVPGGNTDELDGKMTPSSACPSVSSQQPRTPPAGRGVLADEKQQEQQQQKQQQHAAGTTGNTAIATGGGGGSSSLLPLRKRPRSFNSTIFTTSPADDSGDLSGVSASASSVLHHHDPAATFGYPQNKHSVGAAPWAIHPAAVVGGGSGTTGSSYNMISSSGPLHNPHQHHQEEENRHQHPVYHPTRPSSPEHDDLLLAMTRRNVTARASSWLASTVHQHQEHLYEQEEEPSSPATVLETALASSVGASVLATSLSPSNPRQHYANSTRHPAPQEQQPHQHQHQYQYDRHHILQQQLLRGPRVRPPYHQEQRMLEDYTQPPPNDPATSPGYLAWRQQEPNQVEPSSATMATKTSTAVATTCQSPAGEATNDPAQNPVSEGGGARTSSEDTMFGSSDWI